MPEPYVGEIRLFGGNFAPAGWMFCDGQLLPISENEVLFQLIGTTYGGDGEETFALPDLRGRVPLHMGTNPNNGVTFQIGERDGVETVTLTTLQTPNHTHSFTAVASAGDALTPAGNLPAHSANVKLYLNQSPDGNMAADAIAPAGGSQPHENLQPYLGVNYIISLFGEFPSQT
jgi:microcystin-dependent protein